MINNKLINISQFNENEVQIGLWNDNRPVYAKWIRFGALPNASTKSVAHNISNISSIIVLTGVAQRGDTYFSLPYVTATDVKSNISLFASKTDVSVTTGVDRTNLNSCFICLIYTKTN